MENVIHASNVHLGCNNVRKVIVTTTTAVCKSDDVRKQLDIMLLTLNMSGQTIEQQVF